MKSDEELVGFLKGEGLSKALSVVAFSMVKGVAPPVAKSVVHFSRAWASRRLGDEVIHDLLVIAQQSD